jgi:hypothetical protein
MFTGMYWVPFISPELIMILLHLLYGGLVNGQIILSQNSFRDNAGCSVFSGCCAAVAYVVFQTEATLYFEPTSFPSNQPTVATPI